MRFLRKATFADIDTITAVDHEFASGGRKEFFERAIRRAGGYVLEEEGRVIGVGVLEYAFFEHGFISLIYVSPAARRTGAGQMLLQYLVSICETPKLFSSTNLSNEPMKALFAKAGFMPSGMIHNLDPNDSEIVYYKVRDEEDDSARTVT
ncbi:MAG: GNAT family N-acetyltransferase [Chthoniobacterales bacterium]